MKPQVSHPVTQLLHRRYSTGMRRGKPCGLAKRILACVVIDDLSGMKQSQMPIGVERLQRRTHETGKLLRVLRLAVLARSEALSKAPGNRHPEVGKHIPFRDKVSHSVDN
jgi:hypothetical protein